MTEWVHGCGVLCRILAAVYQLPDGLYGVTSGVLRGLGMQPTLLWVNLGGFWGVGILLGILLTFKAHVGVVGLWWGLLSGIVSTGNARWPTVFRSPPQLMTASYMPVIALLRLSNQHYKAVLSLRVPDAAASFLSSETAQ